MGLAGPASAAQLSPGPSSSCFERAGNAVRSVGRLWGEREGDRDSQRERYIYICATPPMYLPILLSKAPSSYDLHVFLL